MKASSLGKWMAGIGAAALLTGALVKNVYDTDRRMYAGWCDLTDSLPRMIAAGRGDEARTTYEETWQDINNYIRTSRRDPISFISSQEIERLERDFEWGSLARKADTYKK